MASEGKDNTRGLVVLRPPVFTLVNLKVKDHCVHAVIFTSSGVSDMDYGLKRHVDDGFKSVFENSFM